MDTPQATGGRGPKKARSPPGRRRAETHQNTHGVQHPVGVPPLAHTAAPCGRSPHGGARAVLTPRGCGATCRSRAKRRGTLADPVAAAARRPPAARRVFLNEDMDRDHEGPRDPHARRTSSTSDPRRRSKRPCTDRPSASGKQRFKRTLARRRAKRPAHPHAMDTRPREPAPDPSPTQGAGRQPSAQSRSRQATEGTWRQPGHDASGPRADTEMTGTSSPQEPAGPLPTATPCSMPRQREPPTGATSRHPSPADAALDQDRVAMPLPPPRPPQQRGTGPFDEAELRALYDIHASTPSSELVATLREHLRNVDPNRLFAVVPLPHAPTTQIFVPQLQALVTPGTQVSDDLIEVWIWWFNTRQPVQGGVWVPHLGWVHTLIAPPTDPRPAPTTGGQERAAPPPRPDNLRIPPHEGLEAWENGTACSSGHNLTNLTAHYPETARAALRRAKVTPVPSP